MMHPRHARYVLLLSVLVAGLCQTAWADIGVNKSFNPISGNVGDVTTVTITPLNPNPGPANNLAFTDAFPAGLVVANPANVSTTCGGTVVANSGDGSFSFSGGSIPPADTNGPGTCAITVDVTSSTSAAYENTLPIGSLSSTRGSNTEEATATYTVIPVLDVRPTKSYGTGRLYGNQTVRLTINLPNQNGIELTNVAITDALPAPIVVASPANESLTNCGSGSLDVSDNTSVALSGATIPANSTCRIEVDVTTTDFSTVRNRARITNILPAGSLTSDEGATNEETRRRIDVYTGAVIQKLFSPDVIKNGETGVFFIRIANYNDLTLTPLNLTDNMPAGITVNSATANAACGSAATITTTASSVSINNGSLVGPNSSVTNGCVITVNYTAVNAGGANRSVRNVIPAGTFNSPEGPIDHNRAADRLTIEPSGNISLAKAMTPTRVARTGVVTTTLTLSNATAVDANITSPLVDDLTTMGTGFVVASTLVDNSPAIHSTTCPNSTLTANPGDTTVTLTGGYIPANGSCTVTFHIQVETNASLGFRYNRLPVGALQTDQGSTLSPLEPRIRVFPTFYSYKYFSPTTLLAGEVSRMRLRFRRYTGSRELTNLSFTDNLPAPMVVADNPSVTSNCNGIFTANPGDTSVSLTGGVVPYGSGGLTECNIYVNVTTPLGTEQTLTNLIPAADITAETTAGNVQSQSRAIRAINVRDASVSLAKGFNPTAVPLGGNARATIQIINRDADSVNLSGVSLVDELPAGMTVATTPNATFSGTGCNLGSGSLTASGTTITLSNVSISRNSTCSIEVDVVANAGGNLINTLPAEALQANQVVTNSQPVSATLTAAAQADLTVTKDDGITTMNAGASTIYNVTVTNNGPNNVAGVTFVDSEPTGVSFTSWTCTASTGAACPASGAGSINTSISLENGASVTFSIVAQVDSDFGNGSITNTASVAMPASVANLDNSDDEASDTNTVTTSAVLTVSKDDGQTTYTPGNMGTYTVIVGNNGPSDALSVSVTDSLPTGVTLSGNVTCAPAGSATCGTVTGSSGGTAFGTSGAAIPAGSANTLTFSVPVSYASNMTSASVTNTASATSPTDSGGPRTGSDTNTLDAVTNLAISKNDGQTNYTPGGSATYTVTVTNANGPSDAFNINIADTLPTGATLSGTPTCTTAGSATCGTLTGTTGGNSFTDVGGSIAAGAGNELRYSVPVAFASNMTTDPLVNSVSASDASGANASASDSDTLARDTGLTVTKTDGQATYTPGTSATYTVVVGNDGPSDASGVSLTDTLPTGVMLNADATCTPSGSASCGSLTGASGGSSVTLSAASIPVGTTLTLTIPVDFDSSLTGNISNEVTASDDTSAPAVSAIDTDTASINSNLDITKSDSTSTYTPGGTGTYVVTITNTGPSDSTGVTASDALPTGVTLSADATCAAAGGASCGTVSGSSGQSNVSVTGASIPKGDSLTLTIPVDFASDLTGTLENTASATDDATTGNVTAVDSNTATPDTGLAISKDDGQTSYTPGDTGTYTIVVSNTGPSDATGVNVTDTLPTGVTLSANATCSAAGTATCGTLTGASGDSAFTDSNASIPAGTVNTLTYTLPVDFAANLTANPLVNTASVQDDTGAAPVEASDSNSATLQTDLSISKDDGQTSYVPGGSGSYTIVVNNAGPSDATGVNVTDTLPTGVTLSANATCSAAGTATCGTLSGATGDSAFTDTNASIPAGAGNTLTYTLPVAFASDLTTDPLVNTASAQDSTGATPVEASDSNSATPQTGLSVSKDDGQTSYTPGNNGTYTIVVNNAGPSDATGVNVTDTLPAGVTLLANATCSAAGTATCGTVSGATGDSSFTDTNASIPAGAANTLTYTLPVTFGIDLRADPLVNIAEVSEYGSTATSSASDTNVFAPTGTDLAIEKTGPATLQRGQDAAYTLVIINTGSETALDVVVEESPDPGLTYVSAGTPCDAGFPCNLGNMEAGDVIVIENVLFTLDATADGDSISNTAIVSSASNDAVSSNQTAVAASVIIGRNPNLPPALIPATRWQALIALLLLMFVGAGYTRHRHRAK